MPEKENKKNTSQDIDKGMESFYSLCKETFFPPLDLSKYDIPEELLKYVPERIAFAYEVIPISRMGSVLTVAVSDPYDIFAVENLSLLTQMDIAPVIAPRKQIVDAIERLYSVGEAVKKKEGEAEKTTAELFSFKEKKFDLEEVTRLSKEASVVKMVNKILGDAVKSRTSDIHIEPFERNVQGRFRIDGILHKQNNIDAQYQEAVIARLKLMSSLDITQRRVPQDGRFGFRTLEKDIDVRVSVLPVDFGEKVVLRLLDRSSVKLDIEKLGFSPYAYEAFKKAISKPFGMILLTGPTGSGKTTTLYCLLNRLNTIERNIITIEDQVEYNLAGIIQVPVRHEIGLDG